MRSNLKIILSIIVKSFFKLRILLKISIQTLGNVTALMFYDWHTQ